MELQKCPHCENEVLPMDDGRCPHCKRKFEESVQEKAPSREKPKRRSKIVLFVLIVLAIVVGRGVWLLYEQRQTEKIQTGRYLESLDSFAAAFRDLQNIPDNFGTYEPKIRRAWERLQRAGLPVKNDEVTNLIFLAEDILEDMTRELYGLAFDVRKSQDQAVLERLRENVESIPPEQIDERIKALKHQQSVMEAMNAQLQAEIEAAKKSMYRDHAIDHYLSKLSALMNARGINLDEHQWQGKVAPHSQRIETWLAEWEKLLDMYRSKRN